MSGPGFPVRRLPDGRAFVNLGSSARAAPGWNDGDFSWIMRLGRHRRLSAFLRWVGLLSPFRYERILKLDPDPSCWDLRRGIPFQRTFDGVYHSHVLEHLDREDAPGFLAEWFRVVKPGGILRVVVPDFELLARSYLDIVGRMPDRASLSEHTFAVEQMSDQMIVRTPRHRALQNPVGELLRTAGFEDLQVRGPDTSAIPGWRAFHLDTEPNGVVFIPSSLYFEGRRPLGSGGTS